MHRIAQACLVWTLVVTCSNVGRVAAQTPSAAADEATLRASVQGYLANVESFPILTCRYTVTAANTRTLEDAIAGREYRGVQVSKRRLFVDGKKVRHAVEADDESMKTLLTGKPKPDLGSKGLSSLTVTFAPTDYLANGDDELLHNAINRNVNLFSLALPYGGDNSSPLAMAGAARGKRNVAYWLGESDAGRVERKVQGIRDVDGTPAFCVSFSVAKGRGRLEYALDMMRGYLPLRATDFADGKVFSRTYLTHIRACSGGRWFPERAVYIWEPKQPGQPYELREVKVVELDVDNRPKPEEFVMELPAGTAVINVPEKRPTYLLKQQERVAPEDLTRLFELSRVVAQQPRADTAVHPRGRYGWVRWVGLVALLGLVVGVVAWQVRRLQA
jgi:hypothetical protein